VLLGNGAWLKTGVFRVTIVTLANPQKDVTDKWYSMWHKVALIGNYWKGLHHRSPGPETISDSVLAGVGALSSAIAAPVALRANFLGKSSNMPSFVSADSNCLQPTAGAGSKVSDSLSDRGHHARKGRSLGDDGSSVITHNPVRGP
jgi:hypothetical protein